MTGEDLHYEISAHSGPALPEPLYADDRGRYLRLPPIDTRIWALARQWAGEGDAFERARRIQEHLRHDFEYSLESSDVPLRDPLGNFLFVTKRGYCEYFASAMAVMLRTLGIPSRVATGFQSGFYNEVSGHVCDARFGRACLGGGVVRETRMGDAGPDAAFGERA